MKRVRRWVYLATRFLADAFVALVNGLDVVGGWIDPQPWGLFEEDSGVHVAPIRDDIEHDLDTLECVCGPDIEYADPETGKTYPSGPLVTHHSLDGREAAERVSV